MQNYKCIFNIAKIIRQIPPQDERLVFLSLRFKLQIPVTCLKYQVAQHFAVIVHICIDGLAVISLG